MDMHRARWIFWKVYISNHPNLHASEYSICFTIRLIFNSHMFCLRMDRTFRKVIKATLIRLSQFTSRPSIIELNMLRAYHKNVIYSDRHLRDDFHFLLIQWNVWACCQERGAKIELFVYPILFPSSGSL